MADTTKFSELVSALREIHAELVRLGEDGALMARGVEQALKFAPVTVVTAAAPSVLGSVTPIQTQQLSRAALGDLGELIRSEIARALNQQTSSQAGQ